jgi:hypothetical protein
MKLAAQRGAWIGCLALCAAACSDTDDDDGVLGPGNIDAGLDLDGGAPVDSGPSLMDASLDGSLMDGGATDGGVTSPLMSFFVSSDKSATANLGGLSGADTRCQTLAAAVGAGAKTWRAFLSVERDPANGNMPTSALTRIGTGPWYNARGTLLASDVNGLLGLLGNAELFVDERGFAIDGQWNSSPIELNEHDVLTGTYLDGGVAVGQTCEDWTSAAAAPAVAQVGHSDGLGPMKDNSSPRNSWIGAHTSESCANTKPRGGAGRIYCFAKN